MRSYPAFNWLLESNTINRESLQSVQRAYISFQDIPSNTFFERTASGESYSMVFHVDTLNTGNTPANAVAQSFDADRLPDEPTEKQFERANPTLVSEAIGPKAPHTFGEAKKPFSYFGLENIKTIADMQRTQSMNGNIFYVWGWIAYTDVFPGTKMHLTEFCQKTAYIGWDPKLSQKAKPELIFQFQACGHHNCADGQCEDYENLIAAQKIKDHN